MDRHRRVAVACATGGFKGVFLHGVLSAFEEEGFRAEAYAAASSSVLPAAMAVTGQARTLGVDHWLNGLEILKQPGLWMSDLVLQGIDQVLPTIKGELFKPDRPRFLVAANAVDPEAALVTQGEGARRLGRQLLLAAARGDRSWVDAHLDLHLFDSQGRDDLLPLTPQNLAEVAYASSRMLHAWKIPAQVGGQAYVDASYTCSCPALQMVDLGYDAVIALVNESVPYRDIFQREAIPQRYERVPIHFVKPDKDPGKFDVNFTTSSEHGIRELYSHGLHQGRRFLDLFSR